MNARVERVFLALLLSAVLWLAWENGHAKTAAPHEDAFTQQLAKLQKVDPDAPFLRVFKGWLVLSFAALGAVVYRGARKLANREKLPDPLAEPPPWSVIDFTLVFLVSLACQQVIGLGVRPLVVMEDGRRLEIAAPVASLSFGEKIPVPGATGESAAIVHSGDELVFRVPAVHDAAPKVFLNGERIVASERVLHRGDRFDVGGVRGQLEAPSSVEYLAAVGLSSLVAPVLVLAFLRLRGAGPRDLGLRDFTVHEALRGVVGYLAMVPGTFVAMILSSLLCRALGVPLVEHPLLRGLEHDRSLATLGMLLLVAGVVAPVSEEILFRGFLLRAVRRPIPSRAAAVLVSSLFFGALHGLSSLLPIFWVGSVFAALFLTSRKGSLLPAILCHALFNSMNVALQWGLLHSA